MRSSFPLALGLVFAATASSPAQIVLKPDGGEGVRLTTKAVDFKTKIKNGVAETVATYDFTFPPFRFQRPEYASADFLITVPENGVVTGFSYWYKGEKVKAYVVEKERAAEIYRTITSALTDPALIEMVGKRTFRVKIFPLDPAGALKVELKMVQSLAPTEKGSTLVLPFRTVGVPTEGLRAQVEADGRLFDSTGRANGPTATFSSGAERAPDWRLTVSRPALALRQEFRAGRTGSAGGFFALTLSPSQALSAPRVNFRGLDVSDVLVETERGWRAWTKGMTLPAVGAGKAVRLVGKWTNARPDAGVDLVSGTYRGSTALSVDQSAGSGEVAGKLWAWAKISEAQSGGRVTEARRGQISAISMRFGVPSPYTSWLAIPEVEKAKFKREIEATKLIGEYRKLDRLLARRSPNMRAVDAQIGVIVRKARALGINPRDAIERAPFLSERLSEMERRAVRGRSESAARLRVAALTNRFERVGYVSDSLRSIYEAQARNAAKRVVAARVAGRRDPQAERALAFAGTRGYQNRPQDYLSAAANERAYAIGNRIVDGRASQGDAQALADLERLANSVPGSTVKAIRQNRGSKAYYPLANEGRELMREEGYDEAKVAKVLDKMRAIHEKWGFREDLSYFFYYEIQRIPGKIANGTLGADGYQKEIDRLEGLARRAGMTLNREYVDSIIGSSIYSWKYAAKIRELQARRDMPRIERDRLEFERLRAALPARLMSDQIAVGSSNPNSALRDAWVESAHADQPVERVRASLKEVDSLRSEEWASARQDRLEALLELDRLDRRAPNEADLRRKAELEERVRQATVRLGDPVVRITLPASARNVHFITPDRVRHAMTFNGQVWEGRFDVPPGSPEGEYTVQVWANGRLVAREILRVDTRPPKFATRVIDGHLEVRSTEDIARVVLIDGDRRIVLTKSAPGVFRGPLPQSPTPEIIVTDRAHNRTDGVAVPPSLARPEGVPMGSAQALATFRGQMWASVLNGPGQWSGDAPTLTAPYARHAVEAGDRFWVRTTDGRLWRFDGETWTQVKTVRPATALVADGETLLVAHQGGWSEIAPDGTVKTRFPAGLAGVRTTALLAEGGVLWVGTQGQGLARVDRASGEVTWIDERHGLRDDWVTALGRESGGRVVVGTFVAGAYRIVNGAAKPIEATSGTCVTALAGDWIATRSGLYRLDASSGAAVRLIDGEFQALLETPEGLRSATRTHLLPPLVTAEPPSPSPE